MVMAALEISRRLPGETMKLDARTLGRLRTYALGMLHLCIPIFPAVVTAQQPADTSALPEVAITGSTVIAFWQVAVSDSILVADPILAMALDDQQYYWAGSRAKLADLGIAAIDQPGRSFRVIDELGERIFLAPRDSAVVGYLLVAPGRDFHAIYRVQYPDALVAAARSFFGM